MICFSAIPIPAITMAALYLTALVPAQTSTQYRRFSAGVMNDRNSRLQAWLMELVPWSVLAQLNGEKVERRRNIKKWVLDTQAEDVKEQAAGMSVKVPLPNKEVEVKEVEALCGGILDSEGWENEDKMVQPLTSIAGRLQSFSRKKGGIGFRFGK